MKDYKDNLAGFANRIKTNNTTTAIQQVKPIITKEEEVQLNVELPKILLKRLKSKCIEREIKIKEFIAIAIINELDN